MGGDIVSLDVFYLWKMLSLIFIFPNDMPDLVVSDLPTRDILNYLSCKIEMVQIESFWN